VGASLFSSDNTIRQYASEIWDIKPLKTDLSRVSGAVAERIIPESGMVARQQRGL
jgi:hypothetical protein